MSFFVMPAQIDGNAGFLYDREDQLRCFYSDELRNWIIVDNSHPVSTIVVGNYNMPREERLYNEHFVWFGYGAGAVFYSITESEWIFNPNGLREPHAEKDLDGTTWVGDGWWGIDGPIRSAQILCQARGTFLNSSSGAIAPTMSWKWPRWEWAAAGRSVWPFGVYVGKDGAEDVAARRIVGAQRYREGSTSRYWLLSQDGLSLSRPNGQTIRFDAERHLWVLGTLGMGTWWQGVNAPNRDDGMTLKPWKHDEASGADLPDADRNDLVLSFYSFVSSGTKSTAFMAEVARWS